jgi:hypothetical protein
MKSSQIQKLIETQIQDDWDRQNVHGYDLNAVKGWLFVPEKTTIFFRDFHDEKAQDHLEEAWLVLKTPSPDNTGYRILAARDGSEFYLAVEDSEDGKQFLVVSPYESFVAAFMGM